MQVPYPALENLGLTFGCTAPVLPEGSFSGPLPHLQVLELESVPFPTLLLCVNGMFCSTRAGSGQWLLCLFWARRLSQLVHSQWVSSLGCGTR
jgi:hypothetical protein